MQIRLHFLAFTLLLAGVSAIARAEQAPDWTLTNATGEAVTFSEVQAAGPSIVLFWATWCPYCKALMPHLQSMLEEYRGERVLRVFALSYREDGDPLEYIRNNGFTFEVFAETGDVPSQYGVTSTPGLFIVDSQGEVVATLAAITASMRTDPGWAQMSHPQKAARRAPYWAARIREALDRLY